MEKRIKFRAFRYYVDISNPLRPGENLRNEQIANFGDIVEIPLEEDLERGERLGAFFSDEESRQLEAGTYRGPGWEVLMRSPALPGLTPNITGGVDVQTASVDEIAAFIKDNNLKVQDTIDLAQNDPAMAEKVLDAEGLATTQEPRATVVQGLEKVMSQVTK